MKKGKFVRSVALVCALALPVGTVAVTGPACRHSNPAFTPEGKIADYANEVIAVAKQALDANARAKTAGFYPKDDAVKINDALGEVGKQGVVLADALAASGAQSDEVKKARAAILSLLNSALDQVGPAAKEKFQPWLVLITNALRFLEFRG